MSGTMKFMLLHITSFLLIAEVLPEHFEIVYALWVGMGAHKVRGLLGEEHQPQTYGGCFLMVLWTNAWPIVRKDW